MRKTPYYFTDIILTIILSYSIGFLVYSKEWAPFVTALGTVLGASAPILVYYYQQRFQKKQIADQKAEYLRNEFREYFMANLKPLIDEILKDKINKFGIYVHRIDDKDQHLSDKYINEYYVDHSNKILMLCHNITGIIYQAFFLNHKKYWLRFSRYFILLDHCHSLYNSHLSKYLTHNPKTYHPMIKIIDACHILVCVDLILAQLEVLLFMNEFDNDIEIFNLTVSKLNEKITDSKLFDETVLFNIDECEKNLEEKWVTDKQANKQ